MAQGNRAVLGIYVGLTLAELEAMKTQVMAARAKILQAHQGYGRPGFNFQRVDFGQTTQDLAEILYAIRLLNGTAGASRVVPDFSSIDPV